MGETRSRLREQHVGSQIVNMKADPFWNLFLSRIDPTPIDHEFVSIEFELAFAVNIRTALRRVEANPACRRLADIALGKAVNYSILRHSRKSAKLVSDAHRAVDEALWRLISELRECEGSLNSSADFPPAIPTRSAVIGKVA